MLINCLIYSDALKKRAHARLKDCFKALTNKVQEEARQLPPPNNLAWKGGNFILLEFTSDMTKF